MHFLITDPGSGVWKVSAAETQPQKLPCDCLWPCVPCAAQGFMAVCCAQGRECLCLEKRTLEVISRMPAPPGVCDLCLSPCGRYVYQLSAEADCIHARAAGTGELLFAAPAGVFPRMMRLDPSGHTLLNAGGTLNEACLLDAPELTRVRTITTRHACFAADFWRGGLVLVCAAEGDDIQTVIAVLGARSVRPHKLLELPGQPGALCVCPDGVTALLSTRDGLMKLDLYTGAILWNQPEWALCMRLCCRGNMALVSDTLDGRICLLNHYRPWERRIVWNANASQACFF